MAKSNLATAYQNLGRLDEALRVRQEVYPGHLKLNGEEHEDTLAAAYNYANTLIDMKRFDEAKALLCKTIPVARRVLGESEEVVLRMRDRYPVAFVRATGATYRDVLEAMISLEDTARR